MPKTRSYIALFLLCLFGIGQIPRQDIHKCKKEIPASHTQKGCAFSEKCLACEQYWKISIVESVPVLSVFRTAYFYPYFSSTPALACICSPALHNKAPPVI